MKRWTLLLLALVSLLAVPIFGEPVTLRGEVLYVATHPAHESGGQFVIMKDGLNEIQIELGPAAFLADHGVQIELRDSITIVGTREVVNNSERIVAHEVTKRGKTVKVRDASGEPLWQQ
jgi:hypothetical protein